MKKLLEADYENNGLRSVAVMRSCFKHLESFFEFDRIVDIDEVRIDEFIADRLEAKFERSTVNRTLAYLRRGFRLMFGKRLISRIPEIKLLDGENVRQGFINAGDLHALLEAIPDPDVRDLVEFLYASGWRSGEAMQFRWSWLEAA
jgi:integrase